MNKLNLYLTLMMANIKVILTVKCFSNHHIFVNRKRKRIDYLDDIDHSVAEMVNVLSAVWISICNLVFKILWLTSAW